MRYLAQEHGVRRRRRGLAIAALGAAVAVCAALPAVAGAGVERHFEQVSPVEKGGGDIVAEGQSIVASRVGDGAVFVSRMQFGDATGSGAVGRTTYLARRSGSGWETRSITPTPRPEPSQLVFGLTKVEVFSDDLSTALLWAYDLPASTDDTSDRQNLYSMDTATEVLRPISVSQAEPLQIFEFIDSKIWGVSADAKHVAVVVTSRLLDEAQPFVPNVYKWDDGVLSLAGVLPDGSVPAGGSTVLPENYRGAMSADGTRLVFSAARDLSTPNQIYLHVDGRSTVWVTEPERGDGAKTPVNGIFFEGMTPDGKNVFFVSEEPLVDGDTAPGPDLYRFTYSDDPASDADNLTLITNSGQALNSSDYGGALVGMSDDARRVYVHESSGQLKLWREGVPGLTTVDPAVPRLSYPLEWLTPVAAMPGNGRVSPDGNWLAYVKDGENDRQMYLYDLRNDVRVCVSCPGSAFLVPDLTKTGRLDNVGLRPRFLTPEGKVFFSSTAGLVSEDTNGVADVYEYDGPSRTLSLVTSGKGRHAMQFVDASESGDDVFFVTRQRLVSGDRDDYIDLYDARVGPGLPDAPVDLAPPCEGDACQGEASIAPDDAVLGSLSRDGGATLGRSRAGLAVRRRVAFRGSVGVLSVRLGTAGRVRWSGVGVASGSVERGSAGTAKLRLRLGHRERERLKRTGRRATTVRLRFVAADGTTVRRSVRVTFQVANRKGR